MQEVFLLHNILLSAATKLLLSTLSGDFHISNNIEKHMDLLEGVHKRITKVIWITDKEAAAPLLWRQTERAGLVDPGEGSGETLK